MADYAFRDNSTIVLNQIGANSKSTMEQAAEMLHEAVQEKILYGYKDVHGNPPHTEIVDTGRLFDSITTQVRRVSQNAYAVDIAANTHYAQYVHEGTYKLKGRPFITDAVMDHQEELKDLLTSGLSTGFDK